MDIYRVVIKQTNRPFPWTATLYDGERYVDCNVFMFKCNARRWAERVLQEVRAGRHVSQQPKEVIR